METKKEIKRIEERIKKIMAEIKILEAKNKSNEIMIKALVELRKGRVK
jgi:hypothetical protein